MVAKKQSTKTAQLYAYSFDRETWQGDFNSREEAMQAAMNDETQQRMSSSIYRDCKAVHASFKIRNSIGYSKN